MDQKLSYFEATEKEIAWVSCSSMVLSDVEEFHVLKKLHCFIFECF